MKSDTESILKQFDPIDQKYQEMNGKTKYRNEFSDLPPQEVTTFQTMCLACIDRIAGPQSQYALRAGTILAAYTHYWSASASELYGVIEALKSAVAAGHLSTLRELIHADVFSDLLENAEYFLKEGHKDPAAVLIGGVLEEHLRQLCVKNSIALEAPNATGVMKPKMGDALNTELYRANVYGQLEQKQVLAWIGLRNKAAHGHYAEYDVPSVELFLQGLRNFISKFPA